MCRYRKWVSPLGALALGMATLLPSVTQAGLADLFRSKKQSPKQTVNNSAYNQQVANKIAGKLRDAKLKGYDIEVEYQSGVATLIGKVTDSAQKTKAEQVVRRVPGVKRVRNGLTLLPKKESRSMIRQTAVTEPAPLPAATSARQAAPAGTNQQVAEEIAGALSSAGLSGFDIEIRYRDGKAALSGKVANPSQRAQAASVVSQVPGVQSVDNRLAVAEGTPQQQQYQQQQFMEQQRRQYQIRQQFQQQQQHRQTAYQPQPAPAAAAGGRPPQGLPNVMGPGGPGPQMMGLPGASAPHNVYNQPNLPEYAWPAHAPYDNYAAVSYPKQHSASAFPYIGPFYPYPQVPLGWRQVQLEWDDGYWNLNFRPRTDKWWWFINPKNW